MADASLGSALGIVVGARDADATAGFFAALGFQQAPGRYYQLPGESEVRWLAAPGSSRGLIRLVSTDQPPVQHDPFGRGPSAFDVYCRDIERATSDLSGRGYQVGPIGTVVLGPLVMRQVLVFGPDETRVVLIESDRRRSSLLDTEADRAFSEGHSLVWSVDSVPDSLSFWRDTAGLSAPFDAPVEHPEVARFLQLPRPDVRLRMAMVCDEQVTPLRLEFLCFVDDAPTRPSAPARPAAALGVGLQAVCWQVGDLAAVSGQLAGAGAALGPVRDCPNGAGQVLSGIAPDGVRFELWQPSDAG